MSRDLFLIRFFPLAALLPLITAEVWAKPPQFKIDPITRYVHLSYQVPASAPEEVTVRCEVSLDNGAAWKPARVWPHVSETALQLMESKDWDDAIRQGTVTERRAGGLTRTVIWNPFSIASAKASVGFRVTLLDQARPISRDEVSIELDNWMWFSWTTDVGDGKSSLCLKAPSPAVRCGGFGKGREKKQAPTGGTSLEVREKGVELPQLTYPLDLRGAYVIFVSLPAKAGSIELRLSGDDRPQIFDEYPICSDCGNNGTRLGGETLWKWGDMTRQHLVIKQPHSTVAEYGDEYRAHLDTVRLVPLTKESAKQLDETWNAKDDRRLVVGYNEPYSWAFFEKIVSSLQHWEPLLAFAEARVDIVDIQTGRGGSQMNNETRVGSQLLADTYGDPRAGEVPTTNNVGRMQQFTNMLATQMKYARLLGMKPFANLGATNCYPGTPLESEFSKQHPEWRIGGQLKYEVPEVRRFILRL